MISDSYQQECEGIILELEDTEFFMKFFNEVETIERGEEIEQEDSDEEEQEDDQVKFDEEERHVIISLQYEPKTLERDELKGIAEDINEFMNRWDKF